MAVDRRSYFFDIALRMNSHHTNPPITIRVAKQNDVVAMGKFGTLLMSLHHGWDPERFIASGTGTPDAYTRWLESQLPNPDVVLLVAEFEGTVVGYTYAGLEGHDYMALRGPAGVLYDIFVDPGRRREGIGRRLLEATVDELARLGAVQIVLSTAYRNEAAQHMFTAAEFRPTMIEMTRTIKSDE